MDKDKFNIGSAFVKGKKSEVIEMVSKKRILQIDANFKCPNCECGVVIKIDGEIRD